MIRDYSKGTGSGKAAGKRKANRGRTPARTQAAAPGPRFHAPSFSGGVILGAALVLVMAYLPELTALRPGETTKATPTAPAPTTELRFEFEEILRNAQVTPTPGTYEQATGALGEEDGTELYLQAASFRTQEEADKLRAALLLMDLPAATAPVELATGRWIRVTVGPFYSALQANRAMTELRSRSIAPIWIKRKATG